MILFLDDDSARAALAYQRMTPENSSNTIWCTTAEEAIDVLWNYRNDLQTVMLDHDLGGQQYVHTGREDCGMEVVRYLERLAHDDPKEFKSFEDTEFIVHTWNTYAGPIMTDRLQTLGLRAKYCPFGDKEMTWQQKE